MVHKSLSLKSDSPLGYYTHSSGARGRGEFGANEAHGGGGGVGANEPHGGGGCKRGAGGGGIGALTRRAGGIGANEAHGGGGLALTRGVVHLQVRAYTRRCTHKVVHTKGGL